MSAAFGGLNWSPATFWSSTMHEYAAAMEYHDRQAARMKRTREGG